MNIKKHFSNIGKKISLKEHKRIWFFVIAAIIVIVLMLIWLFGTSTGRLAQYSFFKSFNKIPEEHIIEIYSGGELIKTYEGFYRIEQYQSYYVITSETTDERVDIYGCAIIVNEKKLSSIPEGE